MPYSDLDLMQRWQQGDALAFEVLVRRWQGPVSQFLGRLVGSELVQDLCQEVFLRVYLAGPGFHGRSAFSTWLYQIALNLARDVGRRRQREPLQVPYDEPADPAVSAESAYDQHELAQILAQAQEDLPDPLREVLVLRHYENMSFEDMARLLEAPASTLKSRFAAALTRLRSRLRRLGWSPEEIA